MTVKELIAKLQGLDPDLDVVADAGPGICFLDDAYEGVPEIGARYVILSADKPIPTGPNPND